MAGKSAYTPDVAKRRRSERAYRNRQLHSRLAAAFMRRYPQEAANLRKRYTNHIRAERGPLPGDEHA